MRVTISDWLNHISSLHPVSIDLGLDRITTVAKRLGVTIFSSKVITITGTNGKGSCVCLLENIYRAAGFRVGSYTSPHLLRFNERIRINGEEVSDHALLAAFEKVENARQQITLTYFEFATLVAFVIFHDHPLELILLEVGLGGRLDAVNIIDCDLAIVTTIDLDHMQFLGNTREAIATEKSGIFRKEKPVICGDPSPPLPLVEAAARLNAPLHYLNQDFSYQVAEDNWSWQGPASSYQNLPLLQLKYQNAATCLMAIETLQQNLAVSANAIHTGLQQSFIQGRFEWGQFEDSAGPVEYICDVAHNAQSAYWLGEQLQQHQMKGPFYAVVAMLSDKAVAQSLENLLPIFDAWFVAGIDDPRGDDGSQIISYLAEQQVKSSYNFATIIDAFLAAVAHAQLSKGIVVVFGSFHTVAAVKRGTYG